MKNLLLVSQNPDDRVFAQEAASAAGLTVEQVDDPVAGARFIDQHQPPAVFVDGSTQELYQAFENAIQDTIGMFSEKVNANAIHFISSEMPENTKYLVQSPLFGHFVLRHFEDPKLAGAHYGRILKATMNKRAFGLSAMMPDGTKIQTVKLQSSGQKQSAVEAIKNYLISAKFQSRMATMVANAVDELLMNAMFDAPVDNLGRPLYTTTSRATNIKLEGKSAVEIQVAFDGSYIGLTAVDHYGSLDKTRLLEHVIKVYSDTEYKVKTAVAGAGIGLATVFRSGGSFFFVSEAQERTEVTVFFKRTDNYREFKDQFRFISTQFYF